MAKTSEDIAREIDALVDEEAERQVRIATRRERMMERQRNADSIRKWAERGYTAGEMAAAIEMGMRAMDAGNSIEREGEG